jgi:hypothetical protein
LLLLLPLADVDVGRQHLVTAFMQQPLLTARVCEACIRSSPNGLMPMLFAVSLIETGAAEGQGVHQSSGPASNPGQLKAGAAAALAADSNQQVQQQLWGLYMSCFKAVTGPPPEASGSTTAAGGASADCHHNTATMWYAAEALLHSAAQDSSSKKGRDQLCCWLVYAARYLRFQCRELVAAAAAAPATSDLQGGMAAAAAPPPAAANAAAAPPQQREDASTATSAAAAAVPAATAASPAHDSAAISLLDLRYVLAKVQLTADCIAQQLRSLSKQQPGVSAAAAAAAADTLDKDGHLQALLTQYGPVLDELERKTLAVCKAENATCRTQQEQLQRASIAGGAQLLQQVMHLAEGVCAGLPLRHCCNNPGCVNLGGLSEAGLVAGAGSRCSRCRACYYCSRECQLAAWPLHKPVCKRLRAAE